MSIPPNWYEDFFHGVALDLWRKAIPPKKTTAEGEFLRQNLGCDPGAHVLDVPCGNGRLSFELAKHGYRVTGVDISKEFIDEARASISGVTDPPANAGGADLVDFILGDMRRIEGDSIYDAAYCFGNSFGFLEYGDMEKFLQGVRRALKPGARFVVETGMAAESVLPDFEEQTSHEIADISVIIKEKYLAEESCIDSEYIFEQAGKSESRLAKHWIYTAAEIRRMFERAGFAILTVYGSLTCEPYKLGSRELIVIAQRASESY
jgi:SAM-dependent methyltransferase